ncbi:MAG: thioredoxin family protein [Candidatus Fimenecus sp.]
MAFFVRVKKKGEKKATPSCCCNAPQSGEPENCREKVQGGISSIKVLGAGCKSCREMFENAKQAVNAMGLGTEVEYITDMQKIMKYGVMCMPALVVNEKVVSQGKVLKPTEITKLLGN